MKGRVEETPYPAAVSVEQLLKFEAPGTASLRRFIAWRPDLRNTQTVPDFSGFVIIRLLPEVVSNRARSDVKNRRDGQL